MVKRGTSILLIFVIGVLLIVSSIIIYKIYAIEEKVEEYKILEVPTSKKISDKIIIEPLDKRTKKIKEAIASRNGIEKEEKYTTEHVAKNGETYTIIGTLKIDKINLEYDIFSKTSEVLLKKSLNKYWGVDPNEVGNFCILGHNWFDSRFFGQLHKLEIDDTILLTDFYGITEEYHVYDKYVVEIDDTSCTSQLTNGETQITLITCYNNGKQRLVVKAKINE